MAVQYNLFYQCTHWLCSQQQKCPFPRTLPGLLYHGSGVQKGRGFGALEPINTISSCTYEKYGATVRGTQLGDPMDLNSIHRFGSYGAQCLFFKMSLINLSCLILNMYN